MRRFATFLFFIVAISWLPGQDAPQFIPEIITHSGSPLLLELSIPDPKGQLSSVAVETGISSTSYEIQPLADRDVVQLTVSPFLVPGSYDLRVLMEADLDGETL